MLRVKAARPQRATYLPNDLRLFVGECLGDLSSTETGTVQSAEHRKNGDSMILARFLLSARASKPKWSTSL